MYMRVYGRTTDPLTGKKTWQVVETDENGFNDNVYLTALCQALQLNTGESPFYANVGIPQQQTIVTQVLPDFYLMNIQTLYSQYFPSLTITKIQSVPEPYYNINVLTNSGAQLELQIPI